MARRHDPEHEALVRAVLCGEVAADDPRRAALDACEECRMQMRELSGLAARLDAAGSEQRSVLRELEDVSLPEAEAVVGDAIRRRARARGASARRVFAAAAAALLLATFLWRPWSAQGPRWLTGSDAATLEVLEPRQGSDGSWIFEWSYRGDERGEFEISFEDGTGAPLFVGGITDASPWTVPAAELRGIAGELTWTVTLVSGGDRGPSSSGSFSPAD